MEPKKIKLEVTKEELDSIVKAVESFLDIVDILDNNLSIYLNNINVDYGKIYKILDKIEEVIHNES